MLFAVIQKWLSETCYLCEQPRKRVNGAWLKAQREKAGLGLNRFARDVAQKSPSYVCEVERNKRPASDALIASYEGL